MSVVNGKELVLDIADVRFSHGSRVVLDGVSLSVGPGQSVAVMGKTGSGKSTLLAIVGGLLRPSSGVVQVAGTNLHRVRPSKVAAVRRRTMGFVFQSGELLPAMTAAENVALAMVLDGVGWPAALDHARDLLSRLDVPLGDVPSAVLSGGERQRAALARALINSPRLVVADEPTGALDTDTRDAVADLLFQRPGHEESGLLLVTHDPVLAARADVVYTLADGCLSMNRERATL